MSRPDPQTAAGTKLTSNEFVESSIDWAIHHLDDARRALKAGDRPAFHCSVRKFGACAKALLDTIPEVVSGEQIR